MICPKCGLQALPDQKFCRSCGAILQIGTQPLAEPTNVFALETSPMPSRDKKRRANRVALWGLIIMFIGVIVGVTGKMLMHEELVTSVGVFVSLAGMFLTVYPYLPSGRRQTHESIASSRPEVVTESQPTRHLSPESNLEYVPSITERTTDLLQSSVATTTRQKEAEDDLEPRN